MMLALGMRDSTEPRPAAESRPGPGTQPTARPRIVALVIGRQERARLRGAVCHLATFDAVETVQELRSRLRDALAPLMAVVVEPVDANGESVSAAVREIRAAFPTVAVIGYCTPVATQSSAILALSQAGVHELLWRGADDSPSALLTTLRSATALSVVTPILLAVEGHLPPDGMAILRYCLEHARGGLSREDLARAMGWSLQGLRRRCRDGGLPSPGALVAWASLLVVAQLLRRGTSTVEHLAVQFGFPSATSLRNKLRRYTGCRAQDIRYGDGLDQVFESFLTAASAGRGAEAEEAP
jgi:AraC-like DNA-binding protein